MRLALMVIVVSVGVYQSHKAVNITGPLSGLELPLPSPFMISSLASNSI